MSLYIYMFYVSLSLSFLLFDFLSYHHHCEALTKKENNERLAMP